MSIITQLKLCVSLEDASSTRTIGLTGKTPNISSSISTMHKACLGTPLQLIRMMQSSTLFGRTTSKHLTIAKRRDASVMALVIWDWYKSLTKPTQTVSIRPACAYSMQSPPQRILLFTMPTSAMPSQRHLLRSKAFTCTPTRPSTNVGRITKGNLLSQQGTLYLYSQLCKATLNPLVCGRSTRMLSFVNLASRL
jgi:hypothetical protein